jgi:hypothetical protein
MLVGVDRRNTGGISVGIVDPVVATRYRGDWSVDLERIHGAWPT